MANKVRGEMKIALGGKDYAVALGLGALAELEDAFGVENFEDALNFEKLSAKRLRTFFIAVLKGNDVDVSQPEILASINQYALPDFMDVVTGLMTSSGLAERTAESKAEDAGAPLAEGSAGAAG